jgi:acetolactate synthase-1/2/3 large subunit
MGKLQNGGQLLIECLINLGASKSFGVPGESYLPVLDALHDTEGQLDFIGCRNEGGAAFMSVAYGKLTATPGICFVTRGPGATNASIGVHTAMQDSTPMLLFVGQVGTAMRYREAFQEVNYEAYFGSIAKWVVEIPEADRIPELVGRAWSTALSGRAGPVVVALPEEVLSNMSTQAPCQPVRIPEPGANSVAMEQAKALISHSKKPLLLVGGRGWGETGKQDLLAFAERTQIPITTMSGMLAWG